MQEHHPTAPRPRCRSAVLRHARSPHWRRKVNQINFFPYRCRIASHSPKQRKDSRHFPDQHDLILHLGTITSALAFLCNTAFVFSFTCYSKDRQTRIHSPSSSGEIDSSSGVSSSSASSSSSFVQQFRIAINMSVTESSTNAGAGVS